MQRVTKTINRRLELELELRSDGVLVNGLIRVEVELELLVD